MVYLNCMAGITHINMKRFFGILLLLFGIIPCFAQAPVSELSIAQHVEDYDFGVKYIEDNYSGFSHFVTAATAADYEALKSRLRLAVSRGERTGWDALAEYTGFFSDFHLVVAVYNANPFEYFKRSFIIYPDKMEYRPTAVARKISDKTFLIRFPSCGGNPDMEWIKQSVAQFKASHCENLVLDIRGNSGGSDYYFYPYLELLYDHESTPASVEFRNTPQNMAYLKSMNWFPEVQQAAAGHPELEFITLPGNTVSCKRDSTVRKAALIIDNAVGSSGEEMVLQIKSSSDRVTVYGRDNTFGCLDFANVSHVVLPRSGVHFSVPTSRRAGLPGTSVDSNGIAPDVRINLPLPARLTDNADEWTIYVAAQMENG